MKNFNPLEGALVCLSLLGVVGAVSLTTYIGSESEADILPVVAMKSVMVTPMVSPITGESKATHVVIDKDGRCYGIVTPHGWRVCKGEKDWKSLPTIKREVFFTIPVD